MKISLAITATCLVLLLSCRDNLDSKVIVHTIEAQPEHARDLKMSDLFDNPRFIELEKSSKSLVGAIRKIEVTERFIVILNDRPDFTINVFTKDGKHLSTFNKYGNGPCEYNSPQFIIVNDSDSTIELQPPTTGNLIKYNIYGECLESTKLPVFGMEGIKLSDDLYALYVSGVVTLDQNKLIDRNLIIVNKNTDIEASYLAFNSESGPAFRTTSRDNFVSNEEGIFLALSCYDTIYQLSEDGSTLTPKYYFDYGSHNVPKELYSKPYPHVGHYNRAVIEKDCIIAFLNHRIFNSSMFFSYNYGEKADLYLGMHWFKDDSTVIGNRICNDFLGEFYFRKPKYSDLPYASYGNDIFLCVEPLVLKKIHENAKELLNDKQYNIWLKKYSRIKELLDSQQGDANPILLVLNPRS